MQNYTITPARYAKNKMIVSLKHGDGYKTSDMYIIEALGGKYVHREHGYNCSKAQADKFILFSKYDMTSWYSECYINKQGLYWTYGDGKAKGIKMSTKEAYAFCKKLEGL
jgi:hypothetical protein